MGISLFLAVLAQQEVAAKSSPASLLTQYPAAAEDEGASDRSSQLDLLDFVHLVREKNEELMAHKIDWLIKREGVNNALSIFEPELVATYQHDESNQENTREEFLSRGFLDTYSQKNDEYAINLEQLTITGALIRFGYTVLDRSSNLLTSEEEEYKIFLGGSVTQPLLKNAGPKVTTATIRVSDIEASVGFHEYRQQMMTTVADAVATYWDLKMAQEKLRLRRESLQVAEKILKDNQERFRTGKMAKIEVLEAEAGVAERKSLEIEAQQELYTIMAEAETLLSSSFSQKENGIKAIEPLKAEAHLPDLDSVLARAFHLQPAYITSRMRIDQNDIRLAFAENQRWPQLDLKASYGLNGYDFDLRDAWRDTRQANYDSWTVGLEFRMPIMGGKKTKSELRAIELEKKKSLRELKALEISLTNAINKAFRKVRSSIEQVEFNEKMVEYYELLLETELAWLDAGRSDSRRLLEKEEDFRQAKEAELESLVEYKKADLELKIAGGSILEYFGIEEMEVTL